jgi:hypothetical protein
MTYNEFNESTGFEQKAGFALSNVQKEDIVQFLQWRKSLNRYEVGGGKTVISTVVSLMSGVTVTVVIMPPVLITSWARWLTKVSSNVLVYKGGPKVRKQMTLGDKRWILMSHAIFRIDFERVMKDLHGMDAELIVDEAQALKSPKSKLYTMSGTFVQNRRMQMLTGTPTSTPLDCYTYIRLRSPEMYRSYAHFEQMHVAERDFFGSVKSYQLLDELAANFAVKSIKRTKQEVHGYSLVPVFPDTTYELDPEHYKLYEKLVEEQLLLLDDGSKIDATTAMKLRHACQQIVCNWDYFSGNLEKKSVAYDLIDLTIEQTECLDVTKSKLIIWTYYKMTSRSVLKYLRGKGYYAVGAYSEEDSSKSFDLFMEDPKCRIGVFQYQSAGAGLNPQFVCSESLHLETPTSSMQVTQSFGRLDRMGQKIAPTMRIAIAKGTVQEGTIDQLLHNDDLVVKVELSKSGLRAMLLGENLG